MRGVFTADFHLGNELPGLNKFKIIKSIFKFAKDNEADILVIAGDIYDHLMVSNIIRSMFNSWIKSLSKYTKIYLLLGNHDIGNKTTSLAPIMPLVSDRIRVVDKPLKEKIAGKRLLFIPYSKKEENNPEVINNKFKKLSGRYDFVFAHLSIEGVKIGPSNFMLASTVTKQLINNYFDADKIILGHIHKPQKSGDIYYCGSPDYLNFGERDEKKRFLFYNEKVLNSIETELIPLCQLEITPTEVKGEYKENGVYKLVISCDKKDAGAINLNSVYENIKKKNGKVIKVNWNVSLSERGRAKEINFKNTLSSNVKQYIKKFAPDNLMKEIWEETGGIWKLAKQS